MRHTHKVQGITSLAAVVVSMTFPAVAFAETYHVSTNGNDSNPGSSASPWRTIQKAANTMAAGDTVTVEAGTYDERVHVDASGESGSPMTFEASGTVVTRGFTVEADHIVIDGFEVTDTEDDGTDGVGIYLMGSFNEVRGSYIHHVARQGLIVEEDSNVVKGTTIVRAGHCGIWLRGTNHLIDGVDISDTIQYPEKWANPPDWIDADGIVIDGRGLVIRNSYIHDIYALDPQNDDPHIDCFQVAGNAEGIDIVIENNVLSIPSTDIRCYQVTMQSGDVSNWTFRNNVIHNMCRGLNLWGSSDMKIINNTWYNIEKRAVELHDVSGAVIKNNIFYEVASGAPYVSVDGADESGIGNNLVYGGDGDFTDDIHDEDPQFVDVDAQNFHLQVTSPAIDRGVTLAEVPEDHDGVPRPWGRSYDIGAYEYTDMPPSGESEGGESSGGSGEVDSAGEDSGGDEDTSSSTSSATTDSATASAGTNEPGMDDAGTGPEATTSPTEGESSDADSGLTTVSTTLPQMDEDGSACTCTTRASGTGAGPWFMLSFLAGWARRRRKISVCRS